MNGNDRISEAINMTADEFERELENDTEVENFQQAMEIMREQSKDTVPSYNTPQNNQATVSNPTRPVNTSIPMDNNPIGKKSGCINNPVGITPDTHESVNKDNLTKKSEPIKDETAIDPRDFIKNIKVDLNHIKICDMNPIRDVDNFDFLLNNKSKLQIVAVQSGYIAYVEGLNYDEINSLINSTLDEYGSQLLLAQTIHKMINTTNIGKIPFNKWAAMTSFYDMDNFLYGIYLQTFPGNTKFQVTCGTCENTIDVLVNNDTLISANNDTTMKMIESINQNKKDNPQLSINNSIIHSKERVFLEDSKLIIDIKIPTIKKHLDLLASINTKAKDKAKHLLNFMLFMENIYMLDIKETLRTKEPNYYEVTDRQRIADILKELTYNDANELSDRIEKMISMYRTNFKIKSFVCPKCQTRINDIDIDMETLLFFQILRR